MHLRSRKAEDLNLRQIISLLSFRKPREAYLTDYEYCSWCPTCHAPIDREYVKFCNHCGQKLSWKNVYKIFQQEEWKAERREMEEQKKRIKEQEERRKQLYEGIETL